MRADQAIDCSIALNDTHFERHRAVQQLDGVRLVYGAISEDDAVCDVHLQTIKDGAIISWPHSFPD